MPIQRPAWLSTELARAIVAWIAVGPMSGKSNVTWFLEKRGVRASDDAVQRVLDSAKRTPRLLTEKEILVAARV